MPIDSLEMLTATAVRASSQFQLDLQISDWPDFGLDFGGRSRWNIKVESVLSVRAMPLTIASGLPQLPIDNLRPELRGCAFRLDLVANRKFSKIPFRSPFPFPSRSRSIFRYTLASHGVRTHEIAKPRSTPCPLSRECFSKLLPQLKSTGI